MLHSLDPQAFTTSLRKSPLPRLGSTSPEGEVCGFAGSTTRFCPADVQFACHGKKEKINTDFLGEKVRQ